jgi:hypothetical protein
MPDPMTRRGFLTKASVAAAGGVAATMAAASGIAAVEGLLASAPAVAPAVAPVLPANDDDVTPLGTDVVAHVRNASTGEVSVMAGEREVVIHDRALVAKLLKGARRTGQEA